MVLPRHHRAPAFSVDCQQEVAVRYLGNADVDDKNDSGEDADEHIEFKKHLAMLGTLVVLGWLILG